ncbi:PQQ-binding-like beta-propeller repeat protein [Flavivirga amylovorans]|uniref:PQQ-binding-like beta-propeller repeat protein n=1 Tax=Flavivirga amylovorans TaxID=870486 RepID=A0ABT8WW00_9FLAO|nr:PQQ-binding-like beta-propeller repeat protein [Flavivirga amylovorans]MDO5985859.1 PQQ-binding-like beta-propeller repeat protein [Flavivirga amylovorans]
MIKQKQICTLILVCAAQLSMLFAQSSKGVTSIETGYTISLVRTAKANGNTVLVASSYEGTVLAYSYSGALLWKNELSGFMNHDVWCEDINGDKKDEILVANADGTLYCLDNKGQLMWQFSKNEAPFKSVAVTYKENKAFVVVGSYDTHIYYLDANGKQVLDIDTSIFSLDKARHKNSKETVKAFVTNYIRPAKYKDGSDILVVHGIAATNSNGSFYYFKPLESKPFKKEINKTGRLGEVRIVDTNRDGISEVLIGKTGEANKGSGFYKMDFGIESPKEFSITKLYNKLDTFGYRVTQPEWVKDGGQEKFLVMFGSRILLVDADMNVDKTEILACKYAFNDMWNDKKTNKIILASAQSGGSSIHIINLNIKSWKNEFINLNPPGKIQTILDNTARIKESLKKYVRPSSENKSQPVYFMSESRNNEAAKTAIERIESKYDNPTFLIKPRTRAKENWDRSSILNEKYRNRRDRRMKYTASQKELVESIASNYEFGKGISYWAGHGNDPYMYQLSTTKKILDKANGKKTVLVYPELEDHTKDFEYVMEGLIYPLAKYSREKNAKIFIRTKHLFWQSSIYLDNWKRLISGEFSDVFIPAMEETTDKSMELSLASRLGIWSSGATDSWGARCARDNASFDRSRQHAHQMLPNHFLRTMVYSIASGAQYLDNFAVDQAYMSLLWDLIAEGALYVPKRSEILSFSPVYLSMAHPDERYIEYGNDVKPVVFYNKQEEADNPLVFSRLNGTWPGAPNTEWDFSRYAAGAKERRLNFIPTYNNGMVLITPPQNGVFLNAEDKRKQLDENLHHIYKGKLKEYITDGRQYLSKDGKEVYSADTFYRVIKEDIEKSKKLLPITVSGSVGWVVAEIAPKKLRLTLVDSGYINPKEREVKVTFNKIHPIKVVDILTNESFKVQKNISIDIPLGGFRFIDIVLSDSLY